MAAQTPTAAAVTTTAIEKARKRIRYEGGIGNAKNPPAAATVQTDYAALHAALVLVKADGAFGGLGAATKNAVNAQV